MPSAINEPGRWDVFISHSQRDANAVALAVELYFSLKERGHAVWLDVKMEKRDVAAMEEGAKNSTMVVAIVTDGGGIEENAFFRRDFCLQELRWAKSAGVAIQPILRVDDKKRVGEFIGDAPDDLKDIGKVDWVDLNRGDNEYWDVGVNKLVKRLEEARKRVRQPAVQEAVDKNSMHADALALLKEMHLDKYADALFKEGVVTAADLSLVDDEIMDDVGFSKLEKKKFLKQRPSSARPSSSRAPESSISTVRRGQAAIDSFKARGNWRKLANVRDAATRLQMLSVDAKPKTSTNEAAIESIKEAEGRNNVHAIIEIMKVNVADADVQAQACEAFCDLSVNDENQSRIAQAGGIEAVLSAMKRHENHAGVQEQACRALNNLSVNDENESRIVQAGGIEAVLSAMKRHEDHAGVQKYACAALNNLSVNDDENDSRIGQAGGIEAVVSAMKRHEKHAGVQEQACRALKLLRRSYSKREYNELIAQAGGIEALIAMIRRHDENNEGVLEQACEVLRNLSSGSQEVRARTAEAGGIEAVVAAMRWHEKNAEVQELACMVLYFLSSYGKQRAIDAGATSVIEAALRNHPNNYRVQKQAKDALGKLKP